MTDIIKKFSETGNKVAGDVNAVNATITTVEQALTALSPQIAMADMLIHLGISTVAKIRGYFASKVSDDEILASIMSEVDTRITHRS